MNARDQYDSSDSEVVGLVVQDQHALSVGVNNQADVECIVDSGATCHVCHDYGLFSELQDLEKPLDIVLGDSHTLEATECGTVILILEFGSLRRKCKFNDVLHISELTYNLLSVSKGVDKGFSFTFSENECVIKDS